MGSKVQRRQMKALKKAANEGIGRAEMSACFLSGVVGINAQPTASFYNVFTEL